MRQFYGRALKKLDRLTPDQYRELLISASGEINRLETVLDSLHTGILVCDEKHNLVKANKAAQRLLPLNYSEGGLWNAVNDERIVEFFNETMLSSDKVRDKEIDVIVQGKNRLLSINIIPLVYDRRITGSLVCIDDITEKRKGESRLRRAENLASLTTLAAGVAHEIKNPLCSISIHLQLLKKELKRKLDKDDHSTDEYFSVLNEEIDRLNRIVVDFLYAVRPVNLELRETDINSIINSVAELINLEFEQAKIKINLELCERLPLLLLDERYMKQALLNLLINAKAAMPKGGALNISTFYSENEIHLLISDTGTGISGENLSKIFEPYFTTKETGTGLGLTQVYKIIKEHRGEITVDSELRKGTVFEIILPAPQKEMRMIEYNVAEGVLK
jgi:nitrogen fixation/metabolism regulation signal transduction histidine kinase